MAHRVEPRRCCKQDTRTEPGNLATNDACDKPTQTRSCWEAGSCPHGLDGAIVAATEKRSPLRRHIRQDLLSSSTRLATDPRKRDDIQANRETHRRASETLSDSALVSGSNAPVLFLTPRGCLSTIARDCKASPVRHRPELGTGHPEARLRARTVPLCAQIQHAHSGCLTMSRRHLIADEVSSTASCPQTFRSKRQPSPKAAAWPSPHRPMPSKQTGQTLSAGTANSRSAR